MAKMWIKGYSPVNDLWLARRTAWHLYRAAGLEIPEDIVNFFDGKEPPKSETIYIELGDMVDHYYAYYHEGCRLLLKDLPADIRFLCFYMEPELGYKSKYLRRSYIEGYNPIDEKWHSMANIWADYRARNIKVPEDVIQFFNGQTPNLGGGNLRYNIDYALKNVDTKKGFYEIDLALLQDWIAGINFFSPYYS